MRDVLRSMGLVFMGLFWAGIAGPAQAQASGAAQALAFQEKPVTREMLAAVRAGGYVLYLRHGLTDNSRADAYPRVDLNDCATQRVLSDEGRRGMKLVGRYIRQARIPIAEVIHSPLCRARESAQLAFAHLGPRVRAEPLLMYPGNLSSEEKKPIVAMTRQLLSVPVAAGGNRVLVAHAPNLADAMNYFVKPEATLVVIRPQGEGRFEYVGSIHPAMWPGLLK